MGDYAKTKKGRQSLPEVRTRPDQQNADIQTVTDFNPYDDVRPVQQDTTGGAPVPFDPFDQNKSSVNAPAISTAVSGADTGSPQGTFAQKWVTAFGNPEQRRRYLTEIYGPENVHYVASSDKWFVRPRGAKDFKPFYGTLDASESARDFLPIVGGMIGGVLAAGASANPVGAPASPATVPAGVGLGAAAGEAANKLIADVTMGPAGEGPVDAAADIASTGFSMAAGEAGGQILGKALGSAVSRIRPFAKGVDRNMVRVGERFGMQLRPAEVSHAPLVESIDENLRSAVGSAGVYRRFESPRFKKVQQLLDNWVSSIGTPTSEYRSYADAVMKAVEGLRTRALGKFDPATGVKIPGISDHMMKRVYDLAGRKFPTVQMEVVGPGGVPTQQMMPIIDIAAAKKTVDLLSTEINAGNKAQGTLKKILGTENNIPMSLYFDLRSEVGELARNQGKEISTRAQRVAAQALTILDGAFSTAVTKYNAPEVKAAWESFRKYYDRMHRFFNEGVIATIAQQSPSDIARTILMTKRPEDVQVIRTVLKRQNPELWKTTVASIFDSRIHGTLEQSKAVFGMARTQSKSVPVVLPNRVQGMWNSLTPEMKRELFTPEQARVLEDLTTLLSNVNIGRPPLGYIGRTIAMSRATAVASALYGSAAFGGASALGYDPVTAGLIGVGGIILLPKMAARMVLSETGRELLTTGLKLGKRGLTSAKFSARLTAYINRPEFAADREELEKRTKAARILSGNRMDSSPEAIDRFLQENPNP